MRSPAPLLARLAPTSAPRTAATKLLHGRISPRSVIVSASGPDRRGRGSRPARTASVPPRLAGWSGLPSILVGRPSWLSTSSPVGVAAERHRRGEEQRLAGHDVLGLPHVGDDVLVGLAGAAGHAGQRQRGAHQLEELAPADRVGPLRRVRGELAVQVLLELRRLGDARPGCASTAGPRPASRARMADGSIHSWFATAGCRLVVAGSRWRGRAVGDRRAVWSPDSLHVEQVVSL